MLSPESLVVLIGAAVSAWQLSPQVLKLRADPSTEGLSPTWAALGVTTNINWAIYRSSQELWLGVPSPLIAATLYVVTLRLMMRGCGWALSPLLAVAVWGSALGAAGMMGGWLLYGTVLGVSTGIQIMPSLIAVYRTRSPRGVAPAVWMLGIAQAVIWGHYGWWHQDAALVLYGVVGGTGSLLVLLRYGYTWRRDNRTGRLATEGAWGGRVGQ